MYQHNQQQTKKENKMAAINATYTFTPAVTGGLISVTGNSETDIKAAVKAVLQTRKDTATSQVTALDTALTEMDA